MPLRGFQFSTRCWATILVANLLSVGVCHAQESPKALVRWTFDKTDDPVEQEIARGKRVGQPTRTYADEVPGAFIYDPLSKTSRANHASAVFRGSKQTSEALITDLDFAKLGLQNSSLSIEAFVKPDPEVRGDTWLVGKSAKGAAGSEISLEWHHIANHGVTFHGGHYRGTNAGANRFPTGHYSTTSRLVGDDPRWRHVAIVYDSVAKTITCWVDYHLSHVINVEQPPKWDDGAFLIGGRADHWGTAGLIDEVRLSRGALGPTQFLRARADAIQGVSFVSNQSIVPKDAGCFDVKEHFGAAGDGKTDDTAAFNAAFAHLASKVPLAYNTLVIPPGEYLITGRLHCSRFIDVKGAGPGKTLLRLKDGTFTDANTPEPVLRMSSTAGAPGSHPWVNGSSISIYLDGLTIDTGKGNPGAKALEYHSNNLGRLENVVLKSGDGTGVIGLDLTHHDVGPALVKRVTVEGFDFGVAIRYQEYSHTFEHLTLKGQKVAGIRNQGNILAIRGLKSINNVPAIVSEGANSMIVLLDSQLTGRATDQPAIRAAGALYCLRVETRGYGQAIAKQIFDRDSKQLTEQTISGQDLPEYIGDRIVHGFGHAPGALKLPIEETPEPAVPPVSEWVNVASFARHKQGSDWSPAVQAAIESGAQILYFPRNEWFEFHTPIRLHAPLERIIGLGGEINWHESAWKNPGKFEQTDPNTAPPPLLIYDEKNADHVLVLDRLGCQHIRHESPATLVLRSSSPNRYSTGLSGGKLFAEDVGGADWHFDHPQQVWVRQWNPESHSAGPCIHSQGATIWSLGFKTEYESQKWLAEKGAQTEILGGFIYPIGEIPADRPIFENRDSEMSLIYGASVYQSNHKIHIRDIRGSETREIGNDQLTWPGSRARMDLFVSDGKK